MTGFHFLLLNCSSLIARNVPDHQSQSDLSEMKMYENPFAIILPSIEILTFED